MIKGQQKCEKYQIFRCSKLFVFKGRSQLLALGTNEEAQILLKVVAIVISIICVILKWQMKHFLINQVWSAMVGLLKKYSMFIQVTFFCDHHRYIIQVLMFLDLNLLQAGSKLKSFLSQKLDRHSLKYWLNTVKSKVH